MTRKTVSDYAKMAAQAEKRVLELLDGALHDNAVGTRLVMDPQNTARPRRGQESSG